MHVYFFLFSRNEILSCQLLYRAPEFEGDLSYKANGRFLISAYVRADDETAARNIAHELIAAYEAAGRKN